MVTHSPSDWGPQRPSILPQTRGSPSPGYSLRLGLYLFSGTLGNNSSCSLPLQGLAKSWAVNLGLEDQIPPPPHPCSLLEQPISPPPWALFCLGSVSQLQPNLNESPCTMLRCLSFLFLTLQPQVGPGCDLLSPLGILGPEGTCRGQCLGARVGMRSNAPSGVSVILEQALDPKD